MNKRNLLLIAAAVMAAGAIAAPLTPEQALDRVRTAGPARLKARTPLSNTPVYTEKTETGAPAAYVFNTAGSGFMVLSGDDVAFPVLGYSDSGVIDPSNMSPEMVYWLGEYARQIEWASQQGAETAKAPLVLEGARPIEPLVKTKWNQDAPYYDQCPTSNNKRCYTGCAATSMAQVMNYHKYPEVGQGKIQYSPLTLPGRTLTLNFALTPFDWANMLDQYVSGEYSEDQGNAVAYLMKACGYSLQMQYGTDQSGASGLAFPDAFITYFKYDVGTHSEERVAYSASEWTRMMYENLRDVGPVILNGRSPLQGGHSFVIDGYDGNGYFHINWGWSGLSDGYFSIDALNPSSQGIGGFVGGFNFSVNAIFGIQPPKEGSVAPEPRLFQYGSSTASISGNEIIFNATGCNPIGWGNLTAFTFSVEIGMECQPIDGTSGETKVVVGSLGSRDIVRLPSNGYYNNNQARPTFTLPSLADGSYRLTLVTKNYDNEAADWIPVQTSYGFRNYVELMVKDGVYTIINVDRAGIQLNKAELLSALYSNRQALIRLEVSNASDMEISEGIAPVLFTQAGTQTYFGESMVLTLEPNETKEFEWSTKFYTQTGGLATVSTATEFILRFYNPETDTYYEGIEVPVTLNPVPSSTTLTLTGLSVENAPFEQREVLGQNFSSVWIPENLHDFNAIFKFRVAKGYYDGDVNFSLLQQDAENPSAMIVLNDNLYTMYPYGERGDDYEVTIPVKDDSLSPGILYFIQASYKPSSAYTSLGRIAFMTDAAGVTVISAEELENAAYFNLQGMRIEHPVPGQMVIVKAGNKAFKTIWK